MSWADELAAGQVKPLHYFDRELVLWRDASGAPHLMDAHCPHLSAHLGDATIGQLGRRVTEEAEIGLLTYSQGKLLPFQVLLSQRRITSIAAL